MSYVANRTASFPGTFFYVHGARCIVQEFSMYQMGRGQRGDVFCLPKITCAPWFHALAGPGDNEAYWKYFGSLDWMSRSCTIVSNLNYYRNDLLFNYSYCRILSCTVLKKEKLSGKMEAFLNDEVSNYFWRGFTEYLKLKKLQLSTIPFSLLGFTRIGRKELD